MAGALATTAATAHAAPQQDDFTVGTHDKTALVAGGVEIAPDFATAFAGPALPSGWTSGNWTATGSAQANNGLTLSEAWAKHEAPTGPGTSLQFRATFSEQKAQHVGFGVDYNTGPWAIFSTSTTGDAVYARINTGTSPDDTAAQVRVGDIATAYDLRIDWTNGNQFVFYVDGVEKARHDAVGMPTTVTALASDVFDGADTVLKLDSMVLRTATSGTFVSRAFDAGTAAVTGVDFTKTTADGLSYETSTSNDGSNWTPFSAAAIQPARFFRYKATFETANPGVSPRLSNAAVDFAIDATAPAVVIGAIAVTGNSAKVPFSSDDGSATYECSLDGGAFAPCSSGVEFGGLPPGTHTVTVRGRDGFGNAGTAAKQFVVAAPPGDTKKARIGMPRDADVTKRGKLRVLLACPDDELRCSVAMKLKWKRATVASKSARIGGGDSRYVALKLSDAARKKLAKAGKLKVLATLTVVDAAGNTRKSSRTIWLYPL